MKSHKDLDVWKDSVRLAKNMYLLTREFPKEEQFGLVSQMRRCAVSIPSNVAEGAARQTQKEFVQFLYIALGSAAELETQIEIARDVGLAGSELLGKLDSELTSIRRKLNGLVGRLKGE